MEKCKNWMKEHKKLTIVCAVLLLLTGGIWALYMSIFHPYVPSDVYLIEESYGECLFNSTPQEFYEFYEYVFVGTFLGFEEEKTFPAGEGEGLPISVGLIRPERVIKGELEGDIEVAFPGGTLPIEEYLENCPHDRQMFQDYPEIYGKMTRVEYVTANMTILEEGDRYLFCLDQRKPIYRNYLVNYEFPRWVTDDDRVFSFWYKKYLDLDKVISLMYFTPQDEKKRIYL